MTAGYVMTNQKTPVVNTNGMKLINNPLMYICYLVSVINGCNDFSVEESNHSHITKHGAKPHKIITILLLSLYLHGKLEM